MKQKRIRDDLKAQETKILPGEKQNKNVLEIKKQNISSRITNKCITLSVLAYFF